MVLASPRASQERLRPFPREPAAPVPLTPSPLCSSLPGFPQQAELGCYNSFCRIRLKLILACCAFASALRDWIEHLVTPPPPLPYHKEGSGGHRAARCVFVLLKMEAIPSGHHLGTFPAFTCNHLQSRAAVLQVTPNS